MVTVFLLSVLIFILFYLYGIAVCWLISHILSVDVLDEAHLPLTVFLGQMAVAVIAMTANVFIPLNGLFVAGLILGALAIAFRGRYLLSFSRPVYKPLVWIILSLAFLTILENATHVPLNPDTGLYHVQSVRWFETYRIVPGLGNFESRYAFNSSWLVLNASLSFAFLGLRSFHLVNGVIFFTGFLYFLDGLSSLAEKKISISNFMKTLFLPLSFYLLSSEISSLGNDMPITFLTWVILLLWVEKLELPSNSDVKDAFIILLSSFALTVKLSSLPLLLLVAFIVVEYLMKKKWRLVFFFGVFSFLIVLPWMVRSVFLSGYLIFPQTQFDFFSLDWKMPRDIVDYTVQGIVGIARLGNSWNPSTPLTFEQWVPKWFDRFTPNRQAMLVSALFSPLLILLAWFRYPSIVSRKFIFAFFVVFTGVIFWFFSAPSIRFGYGFIIAVCVLAVSPFLTELFTTLRKIFSITPTLILLTFAAFQFYSFWYSLDAPTLSQRWFLPADYLPSDTVPCDLDGITIACRPEGTLVTRCFYDVFPCSTLHHIDVKLRGTTYQDGFVLVSEPE